MRYVLRVSSLLLLFIFFAFSAKAQEKEVEIQHYDINLTYDVAKNQLECSVLMDVVRNTENTSFAIWFSDLAVIKSINSEKQPIEFTHNPSRKALTLQIPPTLAKQKKAKIKIDYILPLTKDLVQNGMVFLTQKSYWCPILPQTNTALKLVITTPEYYRANVVGIEDNGKKETGSKWVYQYSAANTDMSFPVMISTQSDINTRSRKIDNTTLSFSFLTAKPETVDTIVERVSKVFEFYQYFLGNYPSTQLSFIEIPGKETKPTIQNGVILFSKNLVADAESGKPVFEDITASQWWGNGVKTTSNTQAYCFLEYSMKEFFSVYARFFDKSRDDFAVEMEAYKAEFNAKNDIVAERSLMDIHAFESENDRTVIKYKGPVVIYYLTMFLGDDVWREFFKEIYQSYNGKPFTFADFEKVLKTYDTDAGDIMNAFQPLLTSTGMPDFVMPAGFTPPVKEEDEMEYFEVIGKESETETPPAE